MTLLNRRNLFVSLSLLAALMQAGHAQEAKIRVAAISLIGDQMIITQYRPSVGSNLDRNERQVVNIPDGYFNGSALRAIDRSAGQYRQNVELIPIRVNDAGIKALQDKQTDQSSDPKELVSAVVAAIRSVNASHVILISKLRSGNQVSLIDGKIGTGFLEGLGFYVDRSIRTRNVNTGESANGFIASHVYARIMLIDAASSKVLTEERVLGSRTTAAYGKEDDDAWRGVSETQKINMLDRIITQEVERIAPALLEKALAKSQ